MTTTGAGQFAGFISALYTSLIFPMAGPLALLALVVAGIMWMSGNTRGLQRAVSVLGAVLLIGFAPYLVTTIYTTATNFAR
jgi:type IV secretory pathway VirB2 component (pilin)